jgi:HPt (histidine-containing phosphotransfer) domain-containing protein
MQQSLNWEAALEYVGGDERLLRELLSVFVEECPRWLADLDRHIAAGDPEGVRLAAHKLKGALVNLGAERPGALAAGIEALGRGRSLAGVDTMIARLREELDQLLPAVRETLEIR